jgi:hypothetical protein
MAAVQARQQRCLCSPPSPLLLLLLTMIQLTATMEVERATASITAQTSDANRDGQWTLPLTCSSSCSYFPCTCYASPIAHLLIPNSILFSQQLRQPRQEKERISAARRWMGGDRRQPQTMDNSLRHCSFIRRNLIRFSNSNDYLPMDEDLLRKSVLSVNPQLPAKPGSRVI